MAKSTDEASPGKGEKTKKKKGNLLPAVIVAIGLFGAAFLMKGGKAKAATTSTTGKGGAAAAGPGGTTGSTTTLPTSAKTLAQIAKLDDITLNLADGHYLKIGIALQLSPKAVVTDYTTGGSASVALDLAISVLGADTYNQLMQPAFRTEAKAELDKQVVAAYGGLVQQIYFTDFVMQ
jgi:flagellar basal body-associated protein FliL